MAVRPDPNKYAPPGFRLTSNPDYRSDEEIAAILQTYRPIDPASDKNVWCFWNTGWEGMRPWCQRNIIAWVRRLGPEWTVRVLDSIEGSPNHLSQFVPSSFFPEAFRDGTIECPPQHVSDLLRLPLLILHGGVWMDVGMILLRHLDDICWNAIESGSSPFEMAGILMPLRAEEGTMLNGFIAAKRENPVIQRWHSVYSALWEGQTSSHGFSAHPLLAHLPPMEVQNDKLGCPPLLIPTEGLGDYLAHFICLERVCRLQEPDGIDGPDYFTNKILLLRAIDHVYYAQKITEWDGREQYDMLATKIEAPGKEQSQAAAKAANFVDNLLQNCGLMKLSHGPPCGKENLASIWDEEAHKDDDIAEGTFAEYLRCATTYWEPEVREPLKAVQIEKPKQVWKGALLEPLSKQQD